ncbi:MAG: hypothetical protein R3C61_19195 [Bacteroidia bacterium]
MKDSRFRVTPLLALLFCLFFFPGKWAAVHAQNMENIGTEKPVKITGSLSLSAYGYHTTREIPRYAPFTWAITGNPVVSLYGITFPFSAMVSEKERYFRQPFNQIGVSPYYRWATFHAGYRNVSFSPFTLSGRTFLGGGVELEPSIFRLGFVYGRFQRRVVADTTLAEAVIEPVYTRKGYAAKLGVGNHRNFVDLVFFKGWDENQELISDPRLGTLPLQENAVGGITSKLSFGKSVFFDLDFAVSAFTHNTRSDTLALEDFFMKPLVLKVYQPRVSSKFSTAGQAGLSFRLAKTFNMRLKYKRIDPDFQSMGAWFFQTNVEDITISPSWSMFKHKLRFNASYGIQRNNLQAREQQNRFRQIGSATVAFSPNAYLSGSLSYSNYQIEARNREGLVVNDSFMVTQVSHNINANVNINFGKRPHRHNLNFNAYYQLFDDQNLIFGYLNDNETRGTGVVYSYSHQKADFSMSGSGTYSDFFSQLANTSRYGGQLTATKGFLEKKLRIRLAAGYYLNQRDSRNDGNSTSASIRLSMKVTKKQSLGLSAQYISRSPIESRYLPYSETRGNIFYTANF